MSVWGLQLQSSSATALQLLDASPMHLNQQAELSALHVRRFWIGLVINFPFDPGVLELESIQNWQDSGTCWSCRGLM